MIRRYHLHEERKKARRCFDGNEFRDFCVFMAVLSRRRLRRNVALYC